MDSKLKEAIASGRYDLTDEGVYVPSVNVLAQGVFVVTKRGENEEMYSENLVVDQGINYLLQAAVGETAGVANWYVALFTGDVTVLPSWDAATFTTAASEWTGYDEATRGAWSNSAVVSGGTDSFASKASFTSSGDAQTVRGAALISASAKNATTGVLLAASRFPSDKSLDTGEILDVGYGLTLTAV